MRVVRRSAADHVGLLASRPLVPRTRSPRPMPWRRSVPRHGLVLSACAALLAMLVTVWAAAPAQAGMYTAADGVLTLSPSAPAAGSPVRVSGDGFRPGTSVRVLVGTRE